jgi:glycosyltransferase involved in cell wall biosynthesis
MRILHVITSLRTGGAEKLVTQLLPYFHANGFEADIAVFDGTTTPFSTILENAGIRIIRLGHGIGASNIYNPRHIYRLLKLIGNYDIIHSHNTSSQLFATLSAFLMKDSPIIVTTEHNTTNRRRHWNWYRPIDRWMYRQHNQIICCSETAKKCLLSSGSISESQKLVTIPNGVSLPEREPNISVNDTKKVVMVSAFRPQKDHITAVKAMLLLPEDVHLYFAGEGTTMQSVKDFVDSNKLNDRVHFLGNVTNIPQLYSSVSCAILSTYYEGMPLSIIEAMAAGAPVIASDVPGVTELVQGAGILVPPADDKALAEAISHLLDNPEERERLISAGLERASHYNIENTAKEYITLYNNLISKHR